MKSNMKWYVKSNSGNAVGGPYTSEEIANEHLVSLDEEYGPHLTVDEVDINELEPTVRFVMKNADIKALKSRMNRKNRRTLAKKRKLKMRKEARTRRKI